MSIQNVSKNSWIVTFTVFLDLFGFGIIIPILPQMISNPFSPYYALATGYTLETSFIILGILTATFPFFQFLSTPILGHLSDSFGRKKILVWSATGTTIAYGLIAIAIIVKSIPLLFLARMLDGVTGGNISVAQASVADATNHENRATIFGLIGAAFGLGLIIGPAVGGILSKFGGSFFGLSLPLWVATLLSLINVILLVFVFKETLPPSLRTPYTFSLLEPFIHVKKAFTYPKLAKVFTSKFLFDFGFSCFTTFFSVYLVIKFAFDQVDIGYLYAFIGIWVALGQILVEKFLPHNLTHRVKLLWAIPLTLIPSLLFLIPNSSWTLYLIVPFFAIGIGMTMVHFLGTLSRMADERSQGRVFGYGNSVQALGQAIPPLLSGFLAAYTESSTPLIVGSIIMMISWIIFMRIPKEELV